MDSANRASMRLLEKIGLAGFFERHKIAPVTFFVLLIGIAAVLVAVTFFPPKAGEPAKADGVCGDQFCEYGLESAISCPADCRVQLEESKTVRIELLGDVLGPIEVSLEDSGRGVMQKRLGSRSDFTFVGVPASLVRAIVRNLKSGITITSEFVSLEEKETIIQMALPQGFFGKVSPPQKATLRVVARDLQTNSSVPAFVTVFSKMNSTFTNAASGAIDGSGYFQLNADLWYAVIAEADGYAPYDGRPTVIKIAGGEEREITAYMQPLVPPISVASLRVCANTSDGSDASGVAELQSLGGQSISINVLSNNCTDFEAAPGNYTIVVRMSSNCTDGSSSIELLLGYTDIAVPVECNSFSEARVKAIGADGVVLTGVGVITAWYPNGSQIRGLGPMGSLLLGQDGYTEFVRVQSSRPFYFAVGNTSGYYPRISDTYSLAPRSSESFGIVMQRAFSPEYTFEMQASMTNPASAGRPFEVTISKITYGSTDVTDGASIDVAVAGVPCNVSLREVWAAECIAPERPGKYDVGITVEYDGRRASFARQVAVEVFAPAGDLRIYPLRVDGFTSPVRLEFIITSGGAPLESLTYGDASLYYEDGGITLPKPVVLEGGNGRYYADAEVPYPGRYRADVFIIKASGSYQSSATASVYFNADPPGLSASSIQRFCPQIVEPYEKFAVYLRLFSAGVAVPSLKNIFVTVEGQKSALSWDNATKTYKAFLSAPSGEGLSVVVFDMGFMRLSEDRLYVVEARDSARAECDISNCRTRDEARECFYDYKFRGLYSESAVARCIDSGWWNEDSDLYSHCASSEASRGDFTDDCELTQNDAEMMENLFNSRDPSKLQSYKWCGDMDGSGAVDYSDLECLKNVVSGKWFGDRGAPGGQYAECPSRLGGGFCFDIYAGLPGDFDGDGLFTNSDTAIMQRIISAAAAGARPPEGLLAIADFNSDGAIDSSDSSCLSRIASAQPSRAAPSPVIPASCLSVYSFGCAGLKGDLNGDALITDTDLLLESWVVGSRVDAPSKSIVSYCADTDGDGNLTSVDYDCLNAMVLNDAAAIKTFCTPCHVQMRAIGRYGSEICHDGLDNDCDNLIDEDCGCNETQACTTVFDVDGIPSTDDFAFCRAFSGPAAGEGDLPDGEYGVYTNGSITEKCSAKEGWMGVMTCANTNYTCLFDYPKGFSIGQGISPGGGAPSHAESFAWFKAAGSIGPIGVIEQEGEYAACPPGWNTVGNFEEDGDCSLITGECSSYKCTYCRFGFDNCRDISCGASGADPAFFSCGPDYDGRSESCPEEHSCFGFGGGYAIAERVIIEEVPGIGLLP